MRVLITGASGFVAPYVSRELRSAGHATVLSDRNGLGDDFVPADLTDRSAVRALVEQAQPDAIIHLGGWSHVGRSWDEPGTVFRVNVEGSINLYREFDAQRGHAGRFLYVSSASVYGDVAPQLLPLGETSPTAPDSPYACSRLAAEQVLTSLARKNGPELIIARPFNHIGRGQHPSFACPSFARRVVGVKRGTAPAVRHGNLAARRDFLHVRDVARAYRLLLDHADRGDLYVIGSGISISLEEVLLRLFALAGIAPRHEVEPDLFRPIDCEELRADPRRVMDATGWRPEVSLDEALAEILAEAEELLSLESPEPR